MTREISSAGSLQASTSNKTGHVKVQSPAFYGRVTGPQKNTVTFENKIHISRLKPEFQAGYVRDVRLLTNNTTLSTEAISPAFSPQTINLNLEPSTLIFDVKPQNFDFNLKFLSLFSQFFDSILEILTLRRKIWVSFFFRLVSLISVFCRFFQRAVFFWPRYCSVGFCPFSCAIINHE